MIDNLKGLVSMTLVSDDPMSVLGIWFPVELQRLIGLKQGPQHFGDVMEHTRAVVEKVGPDLPLRMAALLHDIGKYDTKVTEPDGRIHFHGHEKIGAEITQRLLTELQFDPEFIHDVAFLVRNHMKFKQFGDDIKTLSNKALNRVIRNCENMNFLHLMWLIDADNISHNEEYCMHNQVNNIMKRIGENNMIQLYGYKKFAKKFKY